MQDRAKQDLLLGKGPGKVTSKAKAPSLVAPASAQSSLGSPLGSGLVQEALRGLSTPSLEPASPSGGPAQPAGSGAHGRSLCASLHASLSRLDPRVQGSLGGTGPAQVCGFRKVARKAHLCGPSGCVSLPALATQGGV